MKGIILCQFSSDLPEVGIALRRCLAWPVLSGRAHIVFMARTMRCEHTGFDTIWALSLGSLIEAEAIMKTWKAREPKLREVSIQCFQQMEDELMDMPVALFP
jgi:hypothetical protein